MHGSRRRWRTRDAIEPPSTGALPDSATVCSCNNVSAGSIRCAISGGECTDSLLAARLLRDAGIPAERLHYTGRGVDVSRYAPGTPPDRFRLIFVGTLIKRKGVHHLLRAWKKLGLRDAELVLVGEPHPEIRKDLEACAGPSVRVTGFVMWGEWSPPPPSPPRPPQRRGSSGGSSSPDRRAGPRRDHHRRRRRPDRLDRHVAHVEIDTVAAGAGVEPA